MNILISALSSARYPSGICRHAANLAVSLSASAGVSQVSLLVGRWQHQYFQEALGLADSRVNVVPVYIPNNSCARNVWYWRTLPTLSAKFQPDIVHLSFPAPFVRRSFSCPVVSSLHDLYPYDVPDNFGRGRAFFNRLFLQRCLKESDRVVCSSDFTLDRLRSLAPAISITKGVRIHQTVALDPTQHREPVLPEVGGQPFLLTVAQHRRNKNIGLLLCAFDELRRRDESHQQLRLVVVGGEGPETKALHAMVQRLSIHRDVVFKSALPDAELCWLYRKCKLVVAPSTIEGFGLPVAEALRCGKRVVCSNIPAFREVGSSDCRYFDLSDQRPALALADAIEAAMRSSSELPVRLDRFSPADSATEYVGLYCGLTGGSIPVIHDTRIPEVDSVLYKPYAS
jgi:glycosyltransferase involved in cell wall biosynthesis